MSRRRLAFYDHHRMSFKDLDLHEPDHVEAKFGVGFFAKDGTVWPGGSFSITLRRFRDDYSNGIFASARPSKLLTPRVEVFDDGFGALREFDRVGGLRALERTELRTRDDLSRALVALGLRDDSDDKLPKEES